MRITIEGTFYDKVPFKPNIQGQFSVYFGDKELYFLVAHSHKSSFRGTISDWKIVAEQIQELTVKTSEQLAAEDNVKKCEEALQSAKSVLMMLDSKS